MDTDLGLTLTQKVTLEFTTEQAPALASSGGLLYLAWKGAGNDNLNVAYSEDDGRHFPPVDSATYSDSSDRSPALASGDALYMAWKGSGNEQLNVARVVQFPGSRGVTLEPQILGDTSEEGPALAWHSGLLYLAWKGAGNDNLTIKFSGDQGATFRGVPLEDSSDRSPALASGDGALHIAWKGSGNENLNVATSSLFAGGQAVELGAKHPLPDTTEEGPALAFVEHRLFLAWKGAGNDNLNVKFSADHGATFSGNPLEDTSDRSPALAVHKGRLFMAWKGSGNENINVARVTGFSHTGPLSDDRDGPLTRG